MADTGYTELEMERLRENAAKVVVKGASPDAPIVTNKKGGMQSKVEYGFHLCDYGALFALAEVLQYGASRYARDNWRKIPAEEHFNHMMIHSLAYLSGDKQDDHLGHMFCRAMMFYATAKAEESHTAPPIEPNEDKPEGKYEGLSNEELLSLICRPFCCENCKLAYRDNYLQCSCKDWIESHPTEARALMLDYLNGEGKE